MTDAYQVIQSLSYHFNVAPQFDTSIEYILKGAGVPQGPCGPANLYKNKSSVPSFVGIDVSGNAEPHFAHYIPDTANGDEA